MVILKMGHQETQFLCKAYHALPSQLNTICWFLSSLESNLAPATSSAVLPTTNRMEQARPFTIREAIAF
jgi:hypothetical protein